MSTDNCFPVNPNITDPGMIPQVIEEPCEAATSEVSDLQWWDISSWKLWQKVVVGVIIIGFICLIAYMAYVWITEKKKTKDNETAKKEPPKTEDAKETNSGPDMSEILKAKSQLMAKKAEKESAKPPTSIPSPPKEQIQEQIQEQEQLKNQAIETQRREAYAEAHRRHEAKVRAEAQAHMYAQAQAQAEAQAQAQAEAQAQADEESTPVSSDDGSDRFELITDQDSKPEPELRVHYPVLQDESDSEDERERDRTLVDEKNEDPVEDFLKREIY